jgi:hypothetical protein
VGMKERQVSGKLSCGVCRDSSVGIATVFGLGGPGIEFRCGRGFPNPSRPALVRIQTPIKWLPGPYRG